DSGGRYSGGRVAWGSLCQARDLGGGAGGPRTLSDRPDSGALAVAPATAEWLARSAGAGYTLFCAALRPAAGARRPARHHRSGSRRIAVKPRTSAPYRRITAAETPTWKVVHGVSHAQCVVRTADDAPRGAGPPSGNRP